jgi:di/tricarboxylate transporter
MPLSYASMFGGVCTLLGTSTNILGNSIAVQRGLPAFGMFEFSKLGLIFFGAGALYMLLLGQRLLPDRRAASGLVESFGLGTYLTELVLGPDARSNGKRLDEAPITKDLELEVLDIVRGERRIPTRPDTVLQAGDTLRVRCDAEQIARAQEREGVTLRADRLSEAELEGEGALLVEAVVAPNASLINRSLRSSRFRDEFGGVVLALRHRGALLRGRIEHQLLRGGDTLLMRVERNQLKHLREHRDFVVVSEPDLVQFRRSKSVLALGVLAAVVLSAATGLVSISVSAPAGALLMVMLGVLNADDAYRAIDWKVVMLLAGLLALGAAMEKTGAARLLASTLVDQVGSMGPHAILAVLFLLTMLLTEVMSNNATVVLLMPIAIDTAQSLGVDARPFLFAVMYAASSSFMTPVGYQTNTMIYGPGHYRFSDYLKVGGPLNLLFFVLGGLLIPVLWPF